MEVRLGYKQTEVGVIPVDWLVKPLGELTTLMTNGFVGVATRHYTQNDSGVLYIQGYNVEENAFNFHGIKYVTEAFHRQHMKSCLREGDLLTVQTGDVGLTTFVSANLVGSNCHALIISRFDRKRVESKFVSLYLNSVPGRARLKLIETGTTMKHLNVGDMLHFDIPLPPTMAEQQAIATALSDADALIESLEKLLAKKRQIKQGAMQELLTGKRRLPGFEGEWRAGLLSDVLDSLIAGVSVNSDDGAPTDGVPCVLKTSALSNGKFLDSERKAIVRADWSRAQTTLQANTILISRMNTPDLVGEVAYVAEDCPSLFLPDRIWMTKFRSGIEIDVRWLAYLLCSTEYKRKIKDLATGTSGSMKNISKGALFELPVSFPVAAEQTAIATILSDMDADIATLEAKLAKARAIKQGMLQELLTGRIRLV